MNKGITKAFATVLAVGMTVALAALSHVPYEPPGARAAEVRFAWRARGARVEECRQLTPEELQQVPPHMRQDEICEGRILPYWLEVRLDGRKVVDQLVRGAGAREDRPLYVFENVAVPPGTYELDVRFVRQGELPPDVEEGDTTPARLELVRRVELGIKDVVLVTYDPAARELVLKERGEGAGAEQR